MAGEIPGFNETKVFLENYISDSTINYIVIAIFFILLYDALRVKERMDYFSALLKRLMIHFYNEDDKAFVNARANFVEGLLDEIKSLNLKSNWNDFNYTELEAEVEVSELNELEGTNSKKLAILFLTFKEMVIKRLKPSSKNKIEKSLIRAIVKSKLNFFLVLGDPGSGKTVSLRKLFRILAKKCIDSKDKNAIVPIYVNLKNLNIAPDNISPDKVHSWIVEQICTGQHRDVNDFVKKNFDQMLTNGHLFFLFDSFDEIPAIMRAKENDDVIWEYSSVINRFLKAHNKCKGVISSRHYRSPKGISGQKIVIRPLSMKKIRDALFKYFGTDRRLATDLWITLNQNQNHNILAVVQNPFYLGLLAQYAKDKETIPETNYSLFKHFICQRATYDKDRIEGFDFTTKELIEEASILSYAITKSSNVGLEVELSQLESILKSFKETIDWSQEHCENLINALTYSKFGQLSKNTNEQSKKFSFVHRRFHEFFCALYIKSNLSNIPTETLVQEDQWRETFVLLCEVLRFEDLTSIIDYSRDCLSTGVNCKITSREYTKAGEAVRFLKDGFHNRIDLIPEDIKEKCSEFLRMQIEHKNILEIINCIEGIILVDTKSASSIYYSAFNINSDWIKGNILESCKLLSSMPKEVSKSIKLYLYDQYSKNKILDKFSDYSVLFTSKPILSDICLYNKLLCYLTLLQLFAYSIISLYYLVFNIKFFILLLIAAVSSYTVVLTLHKVHLLFRKLPTYRQIKLQKKLDFNFWIIFPVALVYSILFGLGYGFYGFSRDLFTLECIITFSSLAMLANFIIQAMTSTQLVVSDSLYKNLYFFSKEMALNILIMFSKRNRSQLLAIVVMISIITVLITTFLFAIIHFNLFYHANLVYVRYQSYILLGSVASACLFFAFILGGFIKMAINLAKDMSLLSSIFLDDSKKPKSSIEALTTLGLFKTDYFKHQYICNLMNWTPNEKNIQPIVEEAVKYNVEIQDELYKLANVWSKKGY